MTSKERVKCAFAHKQPDKVPIDFGGMGCSQMHVAVVQQLRDYYGLEKRPVKVRDIAAMTGLIEDDLKDAIGTDVEMVMPYGNGYGTCNAEWKEFRLFDTDLLVPSNFEVSDDGKGGLYIYPEGDRNAPPSGHLPAGGYYFDNIERQEEIDEDDMDPADNLEEFTALTEDALKYYKEQADLHRGSERAVVLDPGGSGLGDASLVPGPGLAHPKGIRSIAEWYMAPLLYPDYIAEVFDRETDLAVKNLEKLRELYADVADVFFVCGTDFGSQISQMCSIPTFEEFYAPNYAKINNWVHANTDWKTLKHSCGAIYPFIQQLIDCGFDSVNPVQCSATGMDPQRLKDDFGDNIVYWGGGVDTQQILPFGTPDQVREQVFERCDIFAKNGGYIFNCIHDIQYGTPVANIVAMFDAIHKYNGDL